MIKKGELKQIRVRLTGEPRLTDKKVQTPMEVVDVVGGFLADREDCVAFGCFNAKGQVIGISFATKDTFRYCSRELYKEAVRQNAAAVVVVQSGERTKADLETLQGYNSAGKLLGIALLDYIGITGGGGIDSARRENDFDSFFAAGAKTTIPVGVEVPGEVPKPQIKTETVSATSLETSPMEEAKEIIVEELRECPREHCAVLIDRIDYDGNGKKPELSAQAVRSAPPAELAIDKVNKVGMEI